MKRKAPPTSRKESGTRRARLQVPDYHLSTPVRNDQGESVWPAPKDHISRARQIITQCAGSGQRTLIVPDKDADAECLLIPPTGLSSGAILHRTLELLGLAPDLINVHLLQKGNTVHSEDERQRMAATSPAFIFVLDQGSRKSGPLIDEPHAALVIDHHYATPTDFPENAEHVTACDSPPVATSSLLTYLICQPLHEKVQERCAWLCVVGTHGDLGNTLKWEPPFPDMQPTLKQYTKKLLNDVVSHVNAPRRTAAYDVISAWTALANAEHPSEVLKHPRLLAARHEVNAEVERCTHAAPQFSPDGKIAVLKIESEAQVHPVIATRWAGHLQSKALEIVLVANTGYLPGKVNFSCRVPRCARGRDPAVDIIQSLKAYASRVPDPDDAAVSEDGPEGVERKPLLERLGDDFARGHVQASGGIVNVDEFEELMRLMRIGEKGEGQDGGGGSRKKGNKKAIDASQKNTLMKYFGKGGKGSKDG